MNVENLIPAALAATAAGAGVWLLVAHKNHVEANQKKTAAAQSSSSTLPAAPEPIPEPTGPNTNGTIITLAEAGAAETTPAFGAGSSSSTTKPPAKFNWWKWVGIAACAGVVGAGTWYVVSHREKKKRRKEKSAKPRDDVLFVERHENPEPATFGKRLRREIATEQRQEARARAAELRATVTAAKHDRKAALAELREECRAELERVKAASLAARAAIKQARVETKTKCRTRRARTREEGRELIEGARRAVKEQRRYQRQLRQTKPITTAKRRRGESQAESDDEVRRNIPEDLIPIFNQVRRDIKGSAKRSRTEAFLEWAEAHPDEVLRTQAEAAEHDADRLWRDYMRQQQETAA